MTVTVAFAAPIDAFAYGEYRRPRGYRPAFTARVTADGSSGVPAEPGRFHLYARWSCPESHRLTILHGLAGLADVVSVSYVDGLRDGRGWAFRQRTGPDPVNGFTLMREAYEASRPGYEGDVSVPVLWDRGEHRIVSNEPVGIGIDLVTAFRAHTLGRGVDVYPAALAAQIESVGAHITTEIGTRVGRAVHSATEASAVRAALRRWDAELATRHRVLGAQLTDADVRLWVRVVRMDAGPNAHGAIGPRLDSYPHLWRWARELYDVPAFRATTRFDEFAAPLADLPPWR